MMRWEFLVAKKKSAKKVAVGDTSFKPIIFGMLNFGGEYNIDMYNIYYILYICLAIPCNMVSC